MSRLILLCGTAIALAIPWGAASAQEAVPATTDQQEVPTEEDEEGEIVVVGERNRGSVIGDIPPENQLDARDIRATGATSIGELLDALAPQIGSARGRGGEAPVLLLNGRRISGFRELRDIPPEAIERMDILPEEVALKYGYRADQRVVNIVLRRRFRSTVARADGGAATEGGYMSGLADATRMTINRDSRTTLNLHAEANSALDEDERDIDLQPGDLDLRPFRNLVGSRQLVRGSATLNRTIFGDITATLNGEIEHSEGKSGIGFEEVPLLRDTTSDSAHLGLALNGDQGKWHLSITGNADWLRSLTLTDRDAEVTDRARSTRTSAGLDGTATGPLFKLPAGEASATFRVGAETLNLDSSRRRSGISSSNRLGRDRSSASVNLDLPILKDSPVGRLTANANAEVEHLSDFGTLTTIGAGLNWAPAERLSLIASWTREEGAPSVNQLGDPILETRDTRIFDFTRGETVSVNATTGGNPALDADRRNVFKLGANWKPFDKTDLRLRADYVRTILHDPVVSFPGPTAALEAAFPKRFAREGGNLVSVDLRPVNFDQARRETIRWGFDFSKPLKTARPSESTIDQLRQQFRRRAGDRPVSETQPPPPPSGEPPPEGAVIFREGPPGGGPGAGGRGGGGGFRGGGMFGGGPNRGRLSLSLTHTLTLADEATIRPGVPDIDYLHGDALNSLGGRSRHLVEVQAGWSNNGLGARLSGNWRSGTRVEGGETGDLRFSPLATVDLRLFANLGERLDLVAKHPWLIGSSVRLEVDNLFDSKPKVRDAFGEVSFSHQSDLLDPLGRTVTISFRKLFLPQRFRARSRASDTTR